MQMLNNARFTPTDAPFKEVSGIQFSIMSSEEILRNSVVEITTTDMFDKGAPKPNGFYDLRMGSIDKRYKCQTCNQDLINCQGHFGHISLAVPMYNISYFKQVYKILQCVCVRCSGLLVSAEEIKRSHVTKARAMLRFKRVFDSVKKQSQCPLCEFQQPKWTMDNSMNIQAVFEDSTVSMTAKHVLNILRKIDDETCNVLGHDPQYAHPTNMIFENLPVPPPVVRPSIVMDPMARTQDDLTHKLIEILKTNQQIVKTMKTKTGPDTIQEQISMLQYHINTYIDNEIPGVPQATQRTGRPIKSICQRIKTKEGRVRGNLMGKRVDFSARTVITAEPNIMLDELGVPESIARNLTITETVTNLNKSFLQDCVDAGPEPNQLHKVGARYVMINQKQKDLRFAKNVRLECGDIVERHLMDGDYVVFNRQPTLHKMSMMGHRVRVMKGNTFRLNLSATAPYNADFDGDEMNLHVPCTHDARAEVKELMMVPKNIVSPQANRPVMGIVQDALLACRKLTMRDVFIDKETMMNILFVLDKNITRLPIPAVLKPRELWTGKQLFSIVLPKRRYMTLKRYSGHREEDETPLFSHTDTEVYIKDGELLTGILCKKTLGTSSDGIIHKAWFEDSPEESCRIVSHIQFISNQWLVENGFSVGVKDCVNTEQTQTRVHSLVSECIDKVHKIIEDGMDRKVIASSYESNINKTLNQARDSSGRYVQQQLDSSNNMFTMVSGGSKGSVINIAQIMACVGQQNVNGERIGYGYTDRTLPHFQRFDNTPATRGFVQHSYMQGLQPHEFFFHAMGGREGVIDTAIKTSESGYIQRRLVKAMEDIRVEFDGTVRNSIGNIIQFKYGEDGMDGSLLLMNGSGELLPMRLSDRTDLRKPFTKPNPELSLTFNNALKRNNVASDDPVVMAYHERAKAAPGEMVGIIAAQSLGQPITQMTLNTFHSAGCGSMNVTLGVPRLKEIINVSKSIKSPSMTLYPLERGLEKHLTRAKLGDFVSSEQVLFQRPPTHFEQKYVENMAIPSLHKSFEETQWCIVYNIQSDTLGQHGLTLLDITFWINNMYDFVWCSCSDENDEHPMIVIRLFPNNNGNDTLEKMTLLSKKILNDMSIKPYPFVEKCFVDGDRIHTLGTNLMEILADDRIDRYRTVCNDIVEVYDVLGIEAARETLVSQIKQVIEFDGSYVDYRHVSILVDTMTYKGSIMAITRHGINRTETGVLMRCSFEETVNILTDAAIHSEFDPIRGVTEHIIMGKTAKVGTGAIDVFVDINRLMQLSMEPTSQESETETKSKTETVTWTPASPSRDETYEVSFFT